MILVVSLNVMVKKCVVCCHSNYQEETTVPVFFFPINHEAHKKKKIRFAKDQ